DARVDIAFVGGGVAAEAGSSVSQLGGNGGASEPGSHRAQRCRPSLNHRVRPDGERLQRTPRWTTSLVGAPSGLMPTLGLRPPPGPGPPPGPPLGPAALT
ncbi:MAG TPA: hypothetical protein VMS00_07500, partial [Acidimicrobiales bacterium]|nr:hypothetical protein [Acidimicrobiales bacterium]